MNVAEALIKVENIVSLAGNEQDIEYFINHRERYRRMATTIQNSTLVGSFVLNIGSHYLHTSLLFEFLGYKVDSSDVSAFWDLDFVRERGTEFGLNSIIEDDLENMPSLSGVTDRYDVIVFAEIMEHITFNPIRFWNHVYRVMKSGGYIYISTPNAFRFVKILSTFKNMILLKGMGLQLKDIFENVTYGHHWKEYSIGEIKRYFGILSEDFEVKINTYHYRKDQIHGFRSFLLYIINGFGNWSGIFADEIEALVSVNKTGSWKLDLPTF